MRMKAAHGLNNVFRNSSFRNVECISRMKWEKYQFEQYVQVVMLTWRAQMWALQIRFAIPVEGWRGVGRDPRGAKAVTFQWQWSHLFCLILCPRGPLLSFWGIMGHILTFPGPCCRLGRIFMVQNGWYRCPAYSTTCFMLDPHLLVVF